MDRVLLQIQNITKSYGKNNDVVHALKGVSLNIYKGEVLGLLGVNGAGKTTLSSIIATLHPPTSGDILWHGNSIYQNLAQYRLKLGFCPQKPNFNPMLNIEQNLYFAGRFFQLTDEQIVERMNTLMTDFELTKYARSKASMLSGGYKQRLLIARSLMHNPELVLLDEPTVALDPHVRYELWDHIKQLKQSGVSVILTTHYLDEAEELSDRVCVLDHGLIKLIDTPENLKNQFQKQDLEAVFLQLMKEFNQN